MNRLDFIICSFMENSIRLKRVNDCVLLSFLGSIYRLCPGVEDKNPKKRKRRKDVKKLLPVADYIVQACKVTLKNIFVSPYLTLFYWYVMGRSVSRNFFLTFQIGYP